MRLVRQPQLWYNLRNNLWDQIGYQIGYHPRSQLDVQHRDQLSTHLKNQLWDQLRLQLNAASQTVPFSAKRSDLESV